MCNGTHFIVEETEKATEWKSKTDECVEFSCHDKSGLEKRRRCSNAEERVSLCFVDGSCISEESIPWNWKVVLDVEEENDISMGDIKISIHELTGIEVNELVFALEINDEGSITRIFVYFEDNDSANDLMNRVNVCVKV